ncbi:class F sortase [Arthrobacter sp. efr-133-R2A-63]|jgi:sortase (surface protein transpeptidase)|uniref:class F sortase n=1 Tax=Arthrobacter sp. efr-133-R2A-63 TaxID=3040278 RepID=UPI0025516D2E|nr:class F sortase [Arthrobacter sp. efr-133-R2A-63]
MIQTRNHSRARRNRVALTAVASFGVAGATAGVLAFTAPPAPPPAQPIPVLSAFTSAEPDTYIGPAAIPSLRPGTLSIPGVDLEVGLVDEGRDDSGYLVVPDAPKAARYIGSAAGCATKGSTLLAGHVNFRDGSLAPMASLAQVTKGMPLYLSDKAGVTCRYKIVGLESLAKTSLPADAFATEGPHLLRVVTCDLASPFVPMDGQAQFANNTVVTAVPWP